MNTEALILFLILLLGLVLCSFLGGNCGSEGFNNNYQKPRFNQNQNGSYNSSYNGSSNGSNVNYDNYNHFNGSSTKLASGSTYHGEDGGSVVVITNSDGSQSLQVTLENDKSPIIFNSQPPTNNTTTTTSSVTESYTNYSGPNGNATVFYGPNGETAAVVTLNNGQQAIRIETSSGTYIFTQSASYYNPNNTSNNNSNISSTQYYGSTGYQVNTYDGAYGGSAATVSGPNGNTAYYAQGPNGNAVAGTTSKQYDDDYDYNKYYGPNGGSAATVSGPNGNTVYYAQGPNGNVVAGTTSNDNANYYDTLPPGIPGSQIKPGDEDLYILKSQVVPPVCPACPSATISRQEPCPACPACARCPEPAFECKKVPNYNAIDSNYLPIPVLNDFSTFGM